MDNDDVRFESIEGSDEDELDASVANNNEDAIFSGGDPDDTDTTESLEEE